MSDEPRARAGWGVVVALGLGYVGVYLARKNLAVAIPLLQSELGHTREELGRIASAGTLAYAAGKLANGVLVDRFGGRAGFLASLLGVALFGAAGALAPGLGWLTLAYAANRFSGAAGWGAMVKVVPTWFGLSRAATVIGALSLSYVLGGVAATLLAREVVERGGGWRAVMGVPSVAVAALLLLALVTVREGPLRPPPEGSQDDDGGAPLGRRVRALLGRRTFLVACGVSFTLTLLREVFNTWSVDWLKGLAGAAGTVATAALHSTAFDLAGGVAILATGVVYDRLGPRGRARLLAGNLLALAAVVALLPFIAAPLLGAAAVGTVGLLVYGPFSLLGGVMAVQAGGARTAATAAGAIDGAGYLAAVLAGSGMGWLLDLGGYPVGFRVLAAITLVGAVVAALGLDRRG